MSASAVSVIRPTAIDKIRTGAVAAKFRDLRASADSLEEWRGVAELYSDENDALRAELESVEREISRLSEHVQRAESDRAALSYQLRSLGHASEAAADEIEPDFSEDLSAPSVGETRFYKKTFSTPNHDVLIHVGDCGHNSWQNASKAEKAKKGVAKLEGSSDWNSIHHCGSCTGGGFVARSLVGTDMGIPTGGPTKAPTLGVAIDPRNRLSMLTAQSAVQITTM